MHWFKRGKTAAFTQKYALNSANIDVCSENIFDLLIGMAVERKNALRIRLAAEDILSRWQEKLGEDGEFTVSYARKFGQNVLRLSAKGAQINPLDADDAEDAPSSKSILDSLGLFPRYRYAGGTNNVDLYLQKPGLNTVVQILLAVVLALVLGGLATLLPVEAVAFVSEVILPPLFNAFMRALTAVAGMLIFLSVLAGILNIGDKVALGKLGSGILKSSVGYSFLVAIIPLLAIRPEISANVDGSNTIVSAFSELYNMILDIIPGDVVSPFSSGNSLQIIVIAMVLGIALLVIGNKGSYVSGFIMEMNQVVQLVMGMLGRLMPMFVFISILQMSLNGSLGSAIGSYKLLLNMTICSFIFIIISLIILILKFRLSPLNLLKKLMPTFIIGITTASSAAALSTNMETCEKKLGISKKIVDFGIPLGQIIYMPGAVFMFLGSAIFAAQVNHVPMSISWIILAVVISVILAIAAPPVPGGSLTCFTVIVTQLGLPMEYLPMLLSINLISEFLCTSVNLLGLQSMLVLLANKHNMLDQDMLKN